MTIYRLDILLFLFGCPVLTVASWPTYRFLKRQIRWSGISISFRIFQFIVIHTVKGFGVVNKAEIDVFLELSCFFDDPKNVGNLISGFSAFSYLFFLKHYLFIFYFTILYWFCHTLTWIRHGCTCVPHPEPTSHLPGLFNSCLKFVSAYCCCCC